MIRIVLNGEDRELPEPATVREALQYLGLPSERVAVELNRRIVPRAEWDGVQVQANDLVEVVHFVGGGRDAAAYPQGDAGS